MALVEFDGNYERVTRTQTLLRVTYQEFLEGPSESRLATLIAQCEEYLNEVSSGRMILPKYLRSTNISGNRDGHLD